MSRFTSAISYYLPLLRSKSQIISRKKFHTLFELEPTLSCFVYTLTTTLMEGAEVPGHPKGLNPNPSNIIK